MRIPGMAKNDRVRPESVIGDKLPPEPVAYYQSWLRLISLAEQVGRCSGIGYQVLIRW
jgi:hypothetical protein